MGNNKISPVPDTKSYESDTSDDKSLDPTQEATVFIRKRESYESDTGDKKSLDATQEATVFIWKSEAASEGSHNNNKSTDHKAGGEKPGITVLEDEAMSWKANEVGNSVTIQHVEVQENCSIIHTGHKERRESNVLANIWKVKTTICLLLYCKV